MAESASVNNGGVGSRNACSGHEVLTALQRLDRFLEHATHAAQLAYGTEAGSDSFRGLHIADADLERMLTREPGAPLLWAGQDAGVSSGGPTEAEGSTLAWLQDAFDLSGFEMDVLLIALAPEVDLRYERLYAYLQDDVTRRRPSVDLALNLLCPTAEAKLAYRASFAPDAPLLSNRLLHLYADPNQVQPPFLAHYLKLDEQVVRLLLGERGRDRRLTPFSRWTEPASSSLALPVNEQTQALKALVVQACATKQPLRLLFHGPRGGGKHRTAEALSGEVGAPLLTADLSRVLAHAQNLDATLKLLFREAWFLGAVLCLEGLDAFSGDDQAHSVERLCEALVDHPGITILCGAKPWASSVVVPAGVIDVHFPLPDFAERRACWRKCLAAGIETGKYELEALAGTFRLTLDQIAAAVGMAQSQAQLRVASQALGNPPVSQYAGPTTEELVNAARAQSGHELEALAEKLIPTYRWDDIVLPEDALAQLRELCQRVTHRHRVLGTWGFDRKLSLGKGVNALFAGPAGTGKTMAAEIIADELQLDLYKIDLPGVVSKYIGETEKNLDRIFRAAENANAILFFDEADALFGKRSEVRDSHDRYANIEISYLLQKMEQYEGVALLATNLRSNLDEAFMRRLAFTIHFPFPDEASRRRIWGGIWPAETPLARDVDPDSLARRFKLTGGNIKNIALAAAFLAAEAGDQVAMAHLLQATRREFQKMGKVLSEDELSGSAG